MKKLFLLLPLLLVGCFHATIYDPEEVKNYVGVSVSGTTETVEYNCQQLTNNPEEVPVVCYFRNVSDHLSGATVRVGWYSNTTGNEIAHTAWGGRWVQPGETQKYYFFFNLATLRLQCGYNLDRCVMLVDKE